jgi:hypothetical protein
MSNININQQIMNAAEAKSTMLDKPTITVDTTINEIDNIDFNGRDFKENKEVLFDAITVINSLVLKLKAYDRLRHRFNNFLKSTIDDDTQLEELMNMDDENYDSTASIVLKLDNIDNVCKDKEKEKENKPKKSTPKTKAKPKTKKDVETVDLEKEKDNLEKDTLEKEKEKEINKEEVIEPKLSSEPPKKTRTKKVVEANESNGEEVKKVKKQVQKKKT